MRHTIDEVAAEAGVSKATVSRVMNNSATVSPKTRARVEAAIKKKDFQPNVNARKLAGGTGGSIALVLEESTEEIFHNPYWKDVIDGFVSQVKEAHQHPVVFFHSAEESDVDLVQAIHRGNWDGIAIFGWHRNIKILEGNFGRDLRVVFGGRQGESKRYTYVGVNNVTGGEIATRHLFEKGCKNVITITGDLSVVAGQERLLGFKNVLKERKIKANKSNIFEGDFTRKGGAAAMREVLASGVEFDGIFVGNDLAAVEVVKILKEKNIKVPKDVKVVGFDGTQLAMEHKPSISSVVQPTRTLGSTVASQLISSRSEKLKNIELPLELFEGESSR